MRWYNVSEERKVPGKPTVVRFAKHGKQRVAGIGLALGAAALLFAACGGTAGPGVASIGSTTTTTAPASTSQKAQFARFGTCMRSHGEPKFQNPIASGNSITFTVSPSLGIGTPRYAHAASDCQPYLPPGVEPPGIQQITPADKGDYLKAVACIHTHGFPSVPDPTFTSGNVHISMPKSIDEKTPRFQRALATCRKLIPAGLPYSS